VPTTYSRGDALVSLPKSALKDYVGSLAADRLAALTTALRIALQIE
jgi:mRNA-degrading endonuclease toxin of MazEF toxin-antitoxin module